MRGYQAGILGAIIALGLVGTGLIIVRSTAGGVRPVAPTLPAASVNAPTATATTAVQVPPELTQTPPQQPRALHIVAPGDTLFRIAQSYGLTVAEVAEVNDIEDPDNLDEGQQLLIPIYEPTATQTPLPRPTDPAATALPPTAEPPTATPAPTADLPAHNMTVNGVPGERLIVISDAARANIRAIYARGQELGRNPTRFSKVGDSTIYPPFFLGRFDNGPYNLGEYIELQAVIDHYRGSFEHESVAVQVGLNSFNVDDPLWADSGLCNPDENPIECEFRLFNPSVVFIRIGTNDAGVPDLFEGNIREVVAFCIDNGVIPIIGTKADLVEGTGQNNNILRRIALDYNLPLWDFEILATTLPGRGLDDDSIHLTGFYEHDYTSSTAYTRGHPMQNLSALMMLDSVWRITQE